MDAEREMTLEEWVARLPPMHRAAREFAALRAQAKAEPVAWIEKADLAVLRRGASSFIDGTRTEAANIPLYTAPPPDHAEALAEACEKFVTAWRKHHTTYHGDLADEVYNDARRGCAYALDAALTRYKESRDG